MLKFCPHICIILISIILASGIIARTVPELPVFLKSPQEFRVGENCWGVALNDLDGDGNPDIVLANISGPSKILSGLGLGNFVESDQVLPDEMHDIAIGDIDNDGDRDLLFAPNQNQTRPLVLNDGQGRFEPSELMLDVCGTVRLVDIENDGDLDAYLGLNSELLLNNGHGVFQRQILPVPRLSCPCDLNGDGFIDFMGAVVEHDTRYFATYLNNGKGEFEEYASLPTGHFERSGFAVADVDNDGDTDILYTNASDNAEGHSGVLLNDRTGLLSGGRSDLPPATAVGKIIAEDLNGDGYVDFVITSWFNPAQVWTNDGQGGFNDTGIRLGEGKGWVNCLVADLDDDTDSDVLLVNRMTGDLRLWFNQASERRGK